MEIANIELQNIKPIMIFGDVDTGKTNLGVYLSKKASEINNLKKYMVGYPKEIDGFQLITNYEEFLTIKNAVIYIDELLNVFDIDRSAGKRQLRYLIQFSAHKNIKLIMNTQATQDIDRTLEGFISCWAFKNIDVECLKMNSKPQKIIKNRVKMPLIINQFGLNIAINQFLWYSQITKKINVYDFPDQFIKKDWSEQ